MLFRTFSGWRPNWALGVAAVLISVTAAPAQTALPKDPTGDWMVSKGLATIRVVDCGGQYWGVVAWEKTPGGVDSNNPDPKLRTRPTLGMPVLRGMTPSKPNEWSGDIYNSQDGRTYSASISLLQPDVLKVQGCVLGFLCGGENWTRVPPDSTSATPAAKPPAHASGTKTASPTTTKPSASGAARPSTGGKAPTTTKPAPTQAADSSEEICSNVAGLAGGAHERRLK